MQKKLIALAIAGLGFTGAAFAQTNVTLYGVVDASVDITDSGDASGATTSSSGQRTTKISSNVSRIGFKGTEDLGDGLKAIFQLETAFNADGTVFANNNSRNTNSCNTNRYNSSGQLGPGTSGPVRYALQDFDP